MAAVAEPPVEDVIAKPHGIVQFASVAEELVLVYAPEYPIFGPHGQRTGQMTEGHRVGFDAGMLRVQEGGTVRTKQGRTLPADEVLAWLRAHQLNGDRAGGFWEVPMVAPAVTDEEFEAVTLASAMADLPRLRALLDAEEKGWARATLLKALRASIERLEEFQAQMEAQADQRDAEEAWSEDDTVASLAKLASDRGLTVVGTGAGGNVVKADVVKALRDSEATS